MKIGESIFDIVYLITVIIVGIVMIKRSKRGEQYRLFGIMAVVLGCGDAFHLVPRVYAMWTTGIAENAVVLGVGKAITSITMTFFYVLLYHVWKKRYDIGSSIYTLIVYFLAMIRIILCLFPQNDWLSAEAPLSWAVYRNIPFAFIGILLILIFYQKAKEYEDKTFRYMWLAITLSFAFYAPVVLYAHKIPAVGSLMIPKTCAYVWIVFMGLAAQNQKNRE